MIVCMIYDKKVNDIKEIDIKLCFEFYVVLSAFQKIAGYNKSSLVIESYSSLA